MAAINSEIRGTPNLITPRIDSLIDEAEKLNPNSEINIDVMLDKELLIRSAGAALSTDELGQETIFLDLARIDEYMIAHELMHLILHRSKYPQMTSIIPESIDPVVRRLADSIDNSFDHYVFDERLLNNGFQPDKYRDWFVDQIELWPDKETKGPAFLGNAISLIDPLIWGNSYKQRVFSSLKRSRRESLELARQITHRLRASSTKSKSSIRNAMINVLEFVDIWANSDSGTDQQFRKLIAISPIFTSRRMKQKASHTLDFSVQQFSRPNHTIVVGALILKSDQTRIKGYIVEGNIPNHPLFNDLSIKLNSLNLKKFLESIGFTKFAIK